MSSDRDELVSEFQDREYRHAYIQSFADTLLAGQIRVLREDRGLTQEQLAIAASTRQAQISRLEDAEYGGYSIRTLKRLAEALDVALLVRFVSFGRILDEMEHLSRDTLAEPSFGEDPCLHSYSAILRLVPSPGRDAYTWEDSPPAGELTVRISGSAGMAYESDPNKEAAGAN